MFCRIVWLSINIFALGIHLAKHGEAQTGRYNFWVGLLMFGVELTLLIGGGFFG